MSKNNNRLLPARCSFCYEILEADVKSVVLCVSCKKRRYCSATCRESDWFYGQDHSRWCRVAGEEDHEWEIAYISQTKEFGLVAKTDLPTGTKILVERHFNNFDHPAFQELAPIGGTSDEKKQTNCLGGADPDSPLFVCPRLARVNHSCDENAFHWQEGPTKVLIAGKPIAKGTEILINYTMCSDPTSPISFSSHKELLESNWRIVCPKSCRCRSLVFISKMQQLAQDHETLPDLILDNNLDAALQKIDQMHQLILDLGADPKDLSRLYYYGFQVCVSIPSLLDQARDFARKKYQIASCLYGPQSIEARKTERYLTDPSLHPRYLCATPDLE